MYWRLPPRSGSFLRRWYLFSSLFGAGYTTTTIQASHQWNTTQVCIGTWTTHHPRRSTRWSCRRPLWKQGYGTKYLRAGLWWPTLHQDSYTYCRSCDTCQQNGRPSRRNEKPLQPQMALQAFDKWAIDFIGPINPPGKKTGTHYIIIATNYVTWWAEAQAVKDCTPDTAAHFIFEQILTRFGCPKILMSDKIGRASCRERVSSPV